MHGEEMTFMTSSKAETVDCGRELGCRLEAGATVALSGELGSGKTAFVTGLAQGLGIEMDVSSPTFTIVNEYPGQIPLFHFDLYRLENADELFDIGWDDYLDRGGVCAVEWSEKAQAALPEETITVIIENLGSDKRRLTVNNAV